MWQYRSACTKKHTHGTKKETAEAKAMPEWARRIPRRKIGRRESSRRFFFASWIYGNSSSSRDSNSMFGEEEEKSEICENMIYGSTEREEERAANKWELRTDKNCHKSPTGKSPSLGKCQIFQFRWNGKPVRKSVAKVFNKPNHVHNCSVWRWQTHILPIAVTWCGTLLLAHRLVAHLLVLKEDSIYPFFLLHISHTHKRSVGAWEFKKNYISFTNDALHVPFQSILKSGGTALRARLAGKIDFIFFCFSSRRLR